MQHARSLDTQRGELQHLLDVVEEQANRAGLSAAPVQRLRQELERSRVHPVEVGPCDPLAPGTSGWREDSPEKQLLIRAGPDARPTVHTGPPRCGSGLSPRRGRGEEFPIGADVGLRLSRRHSRPSLRRPAGGPALP